MLNWWKNRKQSQWPEFYRRYHDRFDQKLPMTTPLRELRLVVLDTETTGFDVQQDRILSIGAIELRGLTLYLENQLSCLVHQPLAVHNRESIPIHGIMPTYQADSCTEEEALENLLDYLGSAVLIAHHAGFDRQMIDAALVRLGAGRLRNHVVDTANLAKRVVPPTHFVAEKQYSLDELAQQYNIELQDRHTALGDAYITAILFLKLVTKLKGKDKFSLGDLLRRHRQYYR